jgi:hypothetical protein
MKRVVIWSFISALVLLAMVLSVIFAVTHKSGAPTSVGVAGNVQPQSTVLITDDCSNAGRIEPSSIVLTCGDGTAVAKDLSWSQWTASTALGRGIIDEVSCVPDCADGRDVTYHVRLTLSSPVRAGSGMHYFTKITVSYLGKGPSGAHMAMYNDCYARPSAPFLPRCPPNERATT